MRKQLTQEQEKSGMFFRYDQLSEKAKKEAYERFAWDFSKNEWKPIAKNIIIGMLDNHWFDKDGGTFVSF